MIRLEITAADIDNLIAQGYTLIRVFTDTAQDGDFTTLDGTVTLVAQTSGYSYVDPDGDSDTWYKVAYWGSSPGQSDKSDAQQGGTIDAYCTAFDVRQELSTGSGSSAISPKWDQVLWSCAVAVSRLVDQYKGLEPGAYMASGSSARTIDGNGRASLWLPWPAVSISLVEVEETDGTYTSWASTDWVRYPRNALTNDPIRRLDVNNKSPGTKQTWTKGMDRVRVTGVWGVSTSPPDLIVRATMTQVAQWYNLVKSGWSTISGTPELGTVELPRKLDPMVKELVRRAPPRMARL